MFIIAYNILHTRVSITYWNVPLNNKHISECVNIKIPHGKNFMDQSVVLVIIRGKVRRI